MSSLPPYEPITRIVGMRVTQHSSDCASRPNYTTVAYQLQPLPCNCGATSPFENAGFYMVSEAEEEAVIRFCDYGATRGNHSDNGESPGPLTSMIPAMQSLVRKILLSRTTTWRVQVTHGASEDVDIGPQP